MINNDCLVKLTNRANSIVGYHIPELSVIRRFEKNETKDIAAAEIRALSQIPGGKAILEKYLIISNKELANEIFHNIEPEYYFTAETIKELLNNGSIDQLLDAIEFGGEGVVDLIKDVAVKIRLNSVRKREIILEKIGFDVTKAIEIKELSEVVEEEAPKTRRATPITESAPQSESTPSGRRAEPPKYNVISRG